MLELVSRPAPVSCVVLVAALAVAAAGCAPSRPDPGADARVVEVVDATSDVRAGRTDAGPAPRGGLDLEGVVLRDGGGALVVEFRVADDAAASPRPASAVEHGELVYVVRLWGEDPDNWFTVQVVVDDGDGTTAEPPAAEVHDAGDEA